jgi:hypothetical protein
MTAAQLLPLLLLYALFKPKPKPIQIWHPAVPAPLPPPLPLAPLHPSMMPASVVPVPMPVHVPVVAPLPPPPAWPVAMPDGLPPFPGPGWVPDSPPPAPVIARAVALLPQLWAQGKGAHTTEQTAGRWITYFATMIGTKKSVVAYRLAPNVYGDPNAGGLVAPTVAPMPPVTSSPGFVPAVYHPPPAGAPPAAVPAAAPAGPVHIPASPAPGLPTLRLTHPETKGPSVVYLQQKLGISDDGVFGTGTYEAVRAFQQAHGLAVDGVVGKNTWAALG